MMDRVDSQPQLPAAEPGADDPTRPTLFALHLTKPSNSEANVLANLLQNTGDAICVELVVNHDGDDDPSSHLHGLSRLPNVAVRSLNVGLPADPWTPESRLGRLRARSSHPIRRWGVLRHARRCGADVVYTSQQRFDCRLGTLVARRLGIPQVIHLHYLPGPWLRRHVQRRLTTCDLVIAISDYIAREAIEAGVDPARVRVIKNTMVVGPAPPDRSPSGRVTLGQIGRMQASKGFHESVAIADSVRARHPEVHLLLVGDGPDRDWVDAAIERTASGDHVTLTGWQADARERLVEIDVFVHPSRAEPFGLAVLEAMVAGLPVVAYGDAGVSELVIDGVTGYLIQPGNLDGFADAVCRLVADPELRREMGTAGRERVRNTYAPETAGREFSSAISTVASSRRSRADRRDVQPPDQEQPSA